MNANALLDIRSNDNPVTLSVDDVLAGLRATPPQLAPIWLYDLLGSHLFEDICEQPEYYLTRTETLIMRRAASEMAQQLGADIALIELGSGNSNKTRLLLDHLQTPAAYVPIDISMATLADASKQLKLKYPGLAVLPVCGDFTKAIDLPAAVPESARRVIYFPGSTFGNFETHDALQLLKLMRGVVGEHGAVLIGIDLAKDQDQLVNAYNDAAGATARFNLNALAHLNWQLGTRFRQRDFNHRAVWVEEHSRIEMHLVANTDISQHIGTHHFRLARGEYIRTECCHKYSLNAFRRLVDKAGWQVSEVWTDPKQWFGVHLLRPADETLSHANL